MFGSHERRLDAKKRLVLPSKLKSDLGDIVFVTLGPDQALEVRSKANFDILSKRLMAQNSLSKEIRSYQRMLLSNTSEVNVDRLGRILIPEHLLAKVAIKNDVMIVGMGDKLEVWNLDNYKAFEKQHAGVDALEKLTQKLYELEER